MANNVYPNGIMKLCDGSFDWDTATTVKCALMTSGYTYNDAHDAYDDISANEVSDASYSAGGNAIASRAVAVDTDKCELDGDDVLFTALDNVVVDACIVYLDSGTPASSWLLSYHDDAAQFPLTANGSNVTIVWSATDKIVQFTT